MLSGKTLCLLLFLSKIGIRIYSVSTHLMTHQKILSHSFKKRKIRYKYMKQYSILVIIKEMQMCTTIEYFETIIKIALKKLEILSVERTQNN